MIVSNNGIGHVQHDCLTWLTGIKIATMPGFRETDR